MLHNFIVLNRQAIIARTEERLVRDTGRSLNCLPRANGIPIFLDQLGNALLLADADGAVDHQQLSESASRYGHDLMRAGLTIAQVVHGYGDVCQTITSLAIEQDAAISGNEFRTLNLCLDDAIAQAVTEYARQRESNIAEQGTERLGTLAHEMRNLLNTAMLSFDGIKSGLVAAGGSTGLVHQRTLTRLRDLIDRSLADVRLDAGLKQLKQISVAEFIEEVEIDASIQAPAHGVQFSATSVEQGLAIDGDRQVLAATMSNLLQNAFKFSRKPSHVYLTTRATADRVVFEVEDECGGLPPGKIEELFLPFEQRGTDRSGVGLGLAICLKAAKANGGELYARDLPGKGCIFTLDLPRKLDQSGDLESAVRPHLARS